MELLTIILFCIVVMISNVFQGITGFAGTIIAMPFAIMLIGIDASKFILNIMGILASAFILLRYHQDVNKKELKRILLYMGIGVIIGLILSTLITIDLLLIILPIVVIIIGVKGLLSRGNSRSYGPIVSRLILLVSGLVHGLFIIGGPILIIYAKNKMPQKQEFRATLSGIWLILNIMILFFQLQTMTFDTSIVAYLIGATIALFGGLKIGEQLHQRMSQSFFMTLTNVLLIISGISILVK